MDSSVPTAEDREFAMLDAQQISTLNAVERMGATLSLLGISLIFVTFAVFRRLRTIPNTFIFFASIANIGACVACLIAYDGITAMDRDRWSPLCQAQGFIFEWFMQSDPWWSFAMAINVYMVFFMSFNPATFRHYLWLYCLLCYGLPAIPAFVFLFIRFPGEPVYGDAVLWCWIASKWNTLRIYSYYLPIWICSVLSAVIYFAVGYHVFHQRNQLRNLSLSNQGKDTTGESSDVRDSAEKNLTSHASPTYYGTVTTEVQVTSATMPTTPSPAYNNPFQKTCSSQENGAAQRPSEGTPYGMTTTVQTPPDPLYIFPPPAQNAPGALSPIQAHNYPWSQEPSSFPVPSDAHPSAATMASGDNTFSFPSSPARAFAPNAFETTNHSFNASNVTSVSVGTAAHQPQDDPHPSPTRLTPLATKLSATTEHPILGSATSRSDDDTDTDPDPRQPPRLSTTSSAADGGTRSTTAHPHRRKDNILTRISRGPRRFGARLRHMDPVKLAYLRTSFVFAISILVTWTPSSINRVYTLIYPDKASYGLNIAAAVVLPLQGVWNAVIYFTTSWRIFREEIEATRVGRRVLEILGVEMVLGRIGTHDEDEEGSGRSGERGGSFGAGLSGSDRGGWGTRGEMGRARRIGCGGDGFDGVEMQSPMSSPPMPSRASYGGRRNTNTMRVTQKGLDAFA